MEYLRYTRDHQQEAEVTGDRFARTVCLLGQAAEGMVDAGAASLSKEHIAGTAAKVGLNTLIGGGLGLLATGENFGGLAARTLATGMTIAFAADVLTHCGEISTALRDNWQSDAHWARNSQIVRERGGTFLFDTALLTATGAAVGRLSQLHANRLMQTQTTTETLESPCLKAMCSALFSPARPMLEPVRYQKTTIEPLPRAVATDPARFDIMHWPDADPKLMEIVQKTYPQLFERQFQEKVSQTVAAVLTRPIWEENLIPKFQQLGTVTQLELHFKERIQAGGATDARVAACEKYGLQREALSSELKGITNERAKSLTDALEPLFYQQGLPPFAFTSEGMRGGGYSSDGRFEFTVSPFVMAYRGRAVSLFKTLMHEYVHINQNYLIARNEATAIEASGIAATPEAVAAKTAAVIDHKYLLNRPAVFRSILDVHHRAEPLTPTQQEVASRLVAATREYPQVERIAYLEDRGMQLQRCIDILETNQQERGAEHVVRALSTPDQWLNIFHKDRGGTALATGLFERQLPPAVDQMRFDWLAAPKDAMGRVHLEAATGWNAEGNRQQLLSLLKDQRQSVIDAYGTASRSYYDNMLEQHAHQATFLVPELPTVIRNPAGTLATNKAMAPTAEQRMNWHGELPPTVFIYRPSITSLTPKAPAL